MSNVVQLIVPSQKQTSAERHGALMRCFAGQRRYGDDVFWLKENAELLNILECSAQTVTPEGLEAYQPFYDSVEKRLEFFPQYYRFLLSICLDLEDLGYSGNKAEPLVKWCAEQELVQAELSDLQRMEARRLMLRRNADPMPQDTGLEARLRAFICRAETFAMPNKKAAYELTHTVFYLSEYGRKDPQLCAKVERSLLFVGLLAFLEQNGDLLAEVCIALRYAGYTVPEIWQLWLIRHTALFEIETGTQVPSQDDYHEFLVCNWMLTTQGRAPFKNEISAVRTGFFKATLGNGALREMSEIMFQLEAQRSSSWAPMQQVLMEELSPNARSVLDQAAASTNVFEEFFEGFARVGLRVDTVQ